MNRAIRTALLGAVGLAAGAAAVVALKEATLSTHDRMPVDSTTTVVLRARDRGNETNQTLGEAVEALLLSCRMEVASDVVGPVRDGGQGRFEATLRPGLDETNRRQFRGCLQDWSIDHLTVDVLAMSTA